MSEIMDLKLNSEMIIFGACDTARADVLKGDGVAILPAPFNLQALKVSSLRRSSRHSEGTAFCFDRANPTRIEDCREAH